MLYGVFSSPQIGPIGSTHQHIDILIHVDGQIVDLNQTQHAHQSSYAHLHQNETDVIHLHAINIPLSWFMNSLNIHLTDSSLTLDGQIYDEDETNKLHIIINGEEIDNIDYEGYNGEKHHQDVFLGWINEGLNGELLSLGHEEVVKNYSWEMPSNWPQNNYETSWWQVEYDPENLAVVAFIQNKVTHEVLQVVGTD
ncbi:MAG: hypothetical protein COA72_06755 [Candidatus Neomarinimicrobiota bacterium]|nr:MAG: hypothetical protein COA72_06755 [Candidatus Neomarinimicrobiota bacterium]